MNIIIEEEGITLSKTGNVASDSTFIVESEDGEEMSFNDLGEAKEYLARLIKIKKDKRMMMAMMNNF